MPQQSVSHSEILCNPMHNELTNLLPLERRRVFTRDYFLRLGVVGVVLVTILVCAAALLLVPTYVFLTQSTSAKEARLVAMDASLSSSNESTLSTRLAALTAGATVLTTLADTTSASSIMREVLAVPRPGISLSDFTYTPGAPKASGTLVVSGTAATRDALRNYQLALQSSPFVLSAALPVSAYAKDTGITFSITVALAPSL